MKERPILFSGAMVRALLDGSKTQTRRPVKWRHVDPGLNMQFSGLVAYSYVPGQSTLEAAVRNGMERRSQPTVCPYGVPGDQLRVKEAAWMWCERRPNGETKTGRQKWLYAPMPEAPVFYAADHPEKPTVSVVSLDTGNVWGWRLKIGRFLPAWASRIYLEIAALRVERLNACSVSDAMSEGVFTWWRETEQNASDHAAPPVIFRDLWESINGAGSWSANPFVWVVEFKRVMP